MFSRDDVEKWYLNVFNKKNLVNDPLQQQKFRRLILAVKEDQFISGAAKLVLCLIYVKLYSKSTEQIPGMQVGECCLDNHAMIDMLGPIRISQGTIQRGLKELKDMDYVTVRIRTCGERRCRLIRPLFQEHTDTTASSD